MMVVVVVCGVVGVGVVVVGGGGGDDGDDRGDGLAYDGDGTVFDVVASGCEDV